MGGQWNRKEQVWEVSTSAKNNLYNALEAVYGYVPDDVETITVSYQAKDFYNDRYCDIRIGDIVTVYRKYRDSKVIITITR